MSNYRVKFCCIDQGGYCLNGQHDLLVFDEKTPYHGEIAFDPDDGTIFRVTVQSELPPHDLVSNAGLVVEYAPVQIAGKSYVCPSRSISVLSAHTPNLTVCMHRRTHIRGRRKPF
jgi:hypothetical protein